jgi:hypothetical protein
MARRRPGPRQRAREPAGRLSDLYRQGAGVDAFLSFRDVDSLHGAGRAGAVRDLGLHHFQNEQHVPGRHLVAGPHQHLPYVAGHHRFDLLGHVVSP